MRSYPQLRNDKYVMMRFEFLKKNTRHFEKKLKKTGYFQIISPTFWFNLCQFISHLFSVVFSVYHKYIRRDLFEPFWRFCIPKLEKWKKHEKMASFPCRGKKLANLFPTGLEI